MAEELNAAAPQTSAGRKLPVLIVALLMLGEGVGIFFMAQALNSGPESVQAGQGDGPGGEGADSGVVVAEPAEIDLGECRPSNKMSGKFITFQIRVAVLVPAERLEEAQGLITAKQARLNDRINFVIRSAELNHLNEPALETIKRRLKHEFSSILNDDTLIIDVLIPEMLQSSAGV
ncbi:MAG: hypothetical protein KJ749_10580 [Planctomycetes bacterium]|nr:hypothetical protein [Planctomycetota bacterium]